MMLVGSSAVIFVLVAAVIGDQIEVYFEWKYLNYTWPSWKEYEEAVCDGTYIKEHNSISGIKVWKDQVYLAVPRHKKGVPVTLATVSKNAATSALLEPYPNWEMQRIGDCLALQSVQGIEIDPQGRMWVINTGRIGVSTEHPTSLCPNRLMIFDIENGEILLDYIFPESVMHFNSAVSNNLVLDHENGGYAYIADFDEENPGIVVFSLSEKRSWKLFHESMRANPKASQLFYNGTPLDADIHVGGIALSPSSDEKGNQVVYYSPSTSYEIFSLSTDILKKNNTAKEILQVKSLGRKLSPIGSMIMSSTGHLYFGYPTEDAIGVWDKNRQSFMNGHKIWANNVKWPNVFDIDEFRFLWNVAKRMPENRNGIIDSSKVNFSIMRSFVNAKNYQYYENGRAPVLPEIADASIFKILFKNFRVSLNHVRKRAFSLS